jgi:hypothetical protein
MKKRLKIFKSKSSKEQKRLISRILFLTTISGFVSLVFSFNFVSLFTPFAAYSRLTKTISFLVVFSAAFTLFLLFYHRFLQKIIQSLGKRLLISGLIAIVFSLITFAFSYAHGPLYLSKVDISILTDSRLGYASTKRVLSNDKQDYLNLRSKAFGEWNDVNGIFVHQGSGVGRLEYEGFGYVLKNTTYSFLFYPQPSPTSGSIEINGVIHEIEIPSSGTDPEPVAPKFPVNSQPAVSLFWRIWLFAFPFLHWLFLLIYFFISSILISNTATQKGNFVIYHLAHFVMSFLFITVLFFQNEFFNFYTFKIQWFALAIVGFILVPFLLRWLLKKYPKGKRPLVVIIFLLAIGLRIYWLVMVPSGQISDFGRFHRWGLQLAQGEPGLLIDRYSVFTRFIGLMYKIYPGHEIIEGLNMLFSLVTMASIWGIGKALKAELAGIIGVYLFAIFPSQISLMGFVCTDIIAVGLLSLSAFLLVHFNRSSRYRYLLLSALSFGFGASLRLPMLMYGLIFVIAFINHQKFQWNKTLLLKIILILSGTAGGFFLVRGITSTVKVEDMVIDEGRNVVWTLINGSNIEALGRNNRPDQILVLSWDEDDVTRNGIRLVINRLVDDPLGFLSVLKQKYAYQFGDGTYGSNIAFLDLEHDYETFTTRWPYETYAVRTAYGQLSQFSYWMILGCACLMLLRPQNPDHKLGIILSISVIASAFFVYTFFEVQPRYQRPIIPFIILITALLFDSFLTNQQNKREGA